ncbi:MAG: hypothetical protein SFU86_21540 [Pirellulaceae bacterium]|nr:hypothetical protein [Pirellulaceae bacterium]
MIDAGESRAAVALTVVWMLATMSCVLAQVVSLAMWLVARGANIPAGRPNALDIVSGILLAVAFLTGLLILLLTGIVLWIRRARPPRAITIVSLLIAVIPVVTIGVLTLLGD